MYLYTSTYLQLPCTKLIKLRKCTVDGFTITSVFGDEDFIVKGGVVFTQRCRDVHVFGCCMLLFPQVVVACLETNPMIFTCIIFKQPQTTTNNPNRNSRYNHQPPKQKFQKKLKNIKNLKKNP